MEQGLGLEAKVMAQDVTHELKTLYLGKLTDWGTPEDVERLCLHYGAKYGHPPWTELKEKRFEEPAGNCQNTVFVTYFKHYCCLMFKANFLFLFAFIGHIINPNMAFLALLMSIRCFS